MANLTYVELITPERVLFSGEAEAVVLRADGADTTFLANHMDYIGAVDICVLRIEGVPAGGPSSGGTGPSSGGTGPSSGGAPVSGVPGDGAATPGEPASVGDVLAALHGGFVEVADNKVTIVAGVAELAEEIDVTRAQRALDAAEGRLSAGDVAEAAAARARVRIAAAVKLKADLGRL